MNTYIKTEPGLCVDPCDMLHPGYMYPTEQLRVKGLP